MNNKGLKVLFSIGLLAVASVVGFFAYTSLYQNAPEIETPPAEEVKESTSSVAIDKASTLFHQERDYEAAIVVLEDTLKNLEAEKSDTDDYLKEESKVKLQLASKLLRNDQIKAFALYAEIYNNQAYPNHRRADAIIDVMWHVTSHLGDGTLTLEQVKNHVLTPERFGSAAGITNPASDVDVYRAAWRLFEIAATLVNNPYKFALAQTFALRYEIGTHTAEHQHNLAHRFGISTHTLEEHQHNRIAHLNEEAARSNRAKPFSLESEIARDPEQVLLYKGLLKRVVDQYNALNSLRVSAGNERIQRQILVSYFFLHYAARDLAQAGFDTTDLLRQMVATMDSYLAGADNRNSHLSNNVFLAESSLTLACQIIVQSGTNITEETKEEVRNVLNNFYSLPTEDMERRYALATIAGLNLHYCHEPYKRIGREIDPRFAEVLVNTVGGWQEADFQ